LQAFVNAIDGVSPTIRNENIPYIKLLCEEFSSEMLLATVSEFLAQHSSPRERVYREVVTQKAQNSALASHATAVATHVADQTAHHLREVAQLKKQNAVLAPPYPQLISIK
jgi:hypothetical protein